MKKITCISYHATGSGAVDDFLREFDDIKFAPRDVECRFLQDPDGIADLEYNLIDNWHRLNSGFAIKRYEKFVKYYNHTYSLIFGDKWKKYSEEYIKKLIEFDYDGYWHCDVRLLNFYKTFIYYCRRAISKITPRKYRKTTDYNYFPNEKSYHTKLTREEFYKITSEYCERLCTALGKNTSEYVILDQFVSTTNVKRYINYVNDLKVIIVDRDPRDLYVQLMRDRGHVLPTEVKKFIEVYRDARTTVNEEIKNKEVLKIQFEDLIYKYDETTKKICDFLRLDDEKHKNKKKYFDPTISIKNTQIFNKDNAIKEKYKKEIMIIEKELKEYLYQF